MLVSPMKPLAVWSFRVATSPVPTIVVEHGKFGLGPIYSIGSGWGHDVDSGSCQSHHSVGGL